MLRTRPVWFPMAPSAEEWEALSPAERAAVAAALPGEVTDAEMSPPEGDRHFKAKTRALGALRGYFARRRRIYLTAELPIYYPVEVHIGGDRKKDAELNIERYARLGIPEYFIYDRARNRLAAYRLASPDARVYTAVLPNHGLYESRVLDLDVQVEQDRLRFCAGTALLLEREELIACLQKGCDDVHQRREEAERLREEEKRLREEAERSREEEKRLREEAEQEVARLRAEIERLKR
jgi:hypothetical protein